MALSDLPTLNAALNAGATTCLLAGLYLIRRRRERAHRNAMLAAFGCSLLFLVSYLYYHAHAGSVRYAGRGPGRGLYLALLASHTALAAAVPPLALRTLWLGLKDRRPAHRRWARWTFPIWLYVSVTGVLIYFILYHWTDSAAAMAAAGRSG